MMGCVVTGSNGPYSTRHHIMMKTPLRDHWVRKRSWLKRGHAVRAPVAQTGAAALAEGCIGQDAPRLFHLRQPPPCGRFVAITHPTLCSTLRHCTASGVIYGGSLTAAPHAEVHDKASHVVNAAACRQSQSQREGGGGSVWQQQQKEPKQQQRQRSAINHCNDCNQNNVKSTKQAQTRNGGALAPRAWRQEARSGRGCVLL